MPDETSVSEDEVRRRAAANKLTIDERYLPGIAKGMERAQAALAQLDPATLRAVEPAVIFRAKG